MDKSVKENIGVWVGKDIEIVKTGKWEVQYYRYNSQNTNYLEAVLISINYDEKNMVKNIRSIVKANLDTKKINYWAKSITNLRSNKKTLIKGDIEKRDEQIKYNIENDNTEIILTANDREEIFTNDKLFIQNKNAEEKQELNKIENLRLDSSKRKPPTPSSNSISACLLEWDSGTIINQGLPKYKDLFEGIYFEINTIDHMYIFRIDKQRSNSKQDFTIYCRAARQAVCNKGVVYNPNFRIFHSSDFKQIEMAKDNRKAKNKLDINVSNFNTDKCVFKKDKEDSNLTSVYWSVKEIESNKKILLNGCGQDYFRIPTREKDEKFIF